MNNKEQLLKKIRAFKEEELSLYKEVKKYCQDGFISLEDRWDVFIESDMGDHKSSIQRYTPLINDYIDQRYWSRYETVYIDYIVDLFEELDEKFVKEFKEDTLQMFIKSFELDW